MDKETFNRFVRQGNLAPVIDALANGQDPNALSFSGLRPLHMAVMRNNGAMAALLMHGGADPYLPDKWGRNALVLSTTHRSKSHGS